MGRSDLRRDVDGLVRVHDGQSIARTGGSDQAQRRGATVNGVSNWFFPINIEVSRYPGAQFFGRAARRTVIVQHHCIACRLVPSLYHCEVALRRHRQVDPSTAKFRFYADNQQYPVVYLLEELYKLREILFDLFTFHPVEGLIKVGQGKYPANSLPINFGEDGKVPDEKILQAYNQPPHFWQCELRRPPMRSEGFVVKVQEPHRFFF